MPKHISKNSEKLSVGEIISMLAGIAKRGEKKGKPRKGE
jgi:hypothetical protein